jgi:hypothetical protein
MAESFCFEKYGHNIDVFRFGTVTQLIAGPDSHMSLTSSCTSNPNSYNASIFLCSKWVSSTEERLLHLPKILVGLFFHSWSSMQACICVQLCIEMKGENGG